MDDLLLIGQDAQNVLKVITSVYPVKGKSFPSYHLGGDIRRMKGPYTNHGTTSILSAKTYIKNVCGKIESTCKVTLRTYGSPMEPDYHPEIDTTPFLSEDETSKYRMLIGCGLWAVTLGRFNIQYAVSTLAQFNMSPRQGHFEACLLYTSPSPRDGATSRMPSSA